MRLLHDSVVLSRTELVASRGGPASATMAARQSHEAAGGGKGGGSAVYHPSPRPAGRLDRTPAQRARVAPQPWLNTLPMEDVATWQESAALCVGSAQALEADTALLGPVVATRGITGIAARDCSQLATSVNAAAAAIAVVTAAAHSRGCGKR